MSTTNWKGKPRITLCYLLYCFGGLIRCLLFKLVVLDGFHQDTKEKYKEKGIQKIVNC
jgi:hypothetical protein